MEYTTNIRVKLIKLVHRLATVDIPQYSIIQYEVIIRAERGTVPHIVVGQ
jgi:hypothetical protein